MSSGVLVSVAEYLASHYDPDRECVDGQVQERSAGNPKHAIVQGQVFGLFWARQNELDVTVLPECRIRLSDDRYRVPDVTLVRGTFPLDRPLEAPPLLVVEVLSPDDRLNRIQERVDEYLTFGVPHVWVIDPESRRVWIGSSNGLLIHRSDRLPVPELGIELEVRDLFTRFDRE